MLPFVRNIILILLVVAGMDAVRIRAAHAQDPATATDRGTITADHAPVSAVWRVSPATPGVSADATGGHEGAIGPVPPVSELEGHGSRLNTDRAIRTERLVFVPLRR